MAGQKIRIRLKAYDHEAIDASARKIVETTFRRNARTIQLQITSRNASSTAPHSGPRHQIARIAAASTATGTAIEITASNGVANARRQWVQVADHVFQLGRLSARFGNFSFCIRDRRHLTTLPRLTILMEI